MERRGWRLGGLVRGHPSGETEVSRGSRELISKTGSPQGRNRFGGKGMHITPTLKMRN